MSAIDTLEPGIYRQANGYGLVWFAKDDAGRWERRDLHATVIACDGDAAPRDPAFHPLVRVA